MAKCKALTRSVVKGLITRSEKNTTLDLHTEVLFVQRAAMQLLYLRRQRVYCQVGVAGGGCLVAVGVFLHGLRVRTVVRQREIACRD